MKKRFLCFLIAILCILPLTLTGCAEDEEVAETGTKPITLTLYGITGETTTEEAIKAVEKELNIYTEGQFNTHIVLKLYPEDEYYKVLDQKLAEIGRIKKEEAAAKKKKEEEDRVLQQMGQTRAPESTVAQTEVETFEENGATMTVYPKEKETQLDIFMVQGASNLNKYYESNHLMSLSNSLSQASRLLNTYISAKFMATTTLGGSRLATGLVDRGNVFGIPNNTVSGEYVYLLVNKKLASQYFYSANDVSTLDTLANFLDDAAKHSDYITLYNEPTIAVEYLNNDPSLMFGGVVHNTDTAFTKIQLGNLLGSEEYVSYLTTLHSFRKQNYITDGDYSRLPEDQKVAAAFLKGNAALPAQYEDDYYVIKYQNPIAGADTCPGTMFCVSSYTLNLDRSMEIIKALQTVPSFRNTFQYGVNNVHYTEDEYTGLIHILNDDYSMDPADTGNLFLLKPNDRMTEAELALAENNWALGKQQYRDTIISPLALFDFRVVTAENYTTTSRVYKDMYQKALKEAEAEAKKNNQKFDASTFEFQAEYPHKFTDEILKEYAAVGAECMQKIENFEEYVDDNGNRVDIQKFIQQLKLTTYTNPAYVLMIATNDDSPLGQYNYWYSNK